MAPSSTKAFAHAEAYLPLGGKYYSLEKLGDGRVWKLPYSIRVLLESGAWADGGGAGGRAGGWGFG